MRIKLISTAAALALGAAACNNDTSEAELNTETNALPDAAINEALGTNAAASATPTDNIGFAAAVAASDLYEIESGGMAEDKASSGEIKSFAAKLQADHRQSTADLKAAADAADVTVAPVLDAEKRAMLDRLKAASGAGFDRLFVEQQKTAHQKALQLLQNYEASGTDEGLKGFARKARPVVQSHLDHLNGMKV